MPRTPAPPAQPRPTPARRPRARHLAARLLATLAALAPLAATPAAHAQYIGGGGLAQLHAPHLLGRWVGVLSGACNRVRTPSDVELTLWSGLGTLPHGTYRLVETCRIPGLVPRVRRGGWTQLRDSSVIVLTLDGELETRAFLKLADGGLRPLDQDLDPIRSQVLSPLE